MTFIDGPVVRHMTPATYTVGSHATLAEVDMQMALRGVSGLLVVDDNAQPLGVITRTDLLRVGRPFDARSGRQSLKLSDRLLAIDIFHPDPVCIDHDRSVRDAAMLMYRRGVHRVLVVEGAEPLGVLSVTDLLHVVAASALTTPLSELASETIAAVDAGATVSYATDRLTAAAVRGLVVTNEGKPIGCFTQREALAAQEAEPDSAVESWMNPSVVSLSEETPLPQAARQAVLTHAPIIVTLDQDRPQGVVTATDMIYALI